MSVRGHNYTRGARGNTRTVQRADPPLSSGPPRVRRHRCPQGWLNVVVADDGILACVGVRYDTNPASVAGISSVDGPVMRVQDKNQPEKAGGRCG